MMEVKQLSQEINDAYNKLNIEAKKVEFNNLNKDLNNPGFWDDNLRASQTAKQLDQLRVQIETWDELKSEVQELAELWQLNDSSIQVELETRLKKLNKRFEQNQLALFFSGKYDSYNAILTIQSGAGGRDAEDWAEMLVRMYGKWAETQGFDTELLDRSDGAEGGVKSATLSINGINAYGLLRGEHGVHRLVRKSPFNTAGSRETSFAMVEVLPQIDQPGEIEIDESELKIDVFRAGGRGGQSVNTTDSAVRVTHIPTGISVAIQNERSQTQNKDTALKLLRSRLAQLQQEQHQEKVSELKGPNQQAAWGNQIRNYVLHPYTLVKDTRTNWETSDVQAVLGGDLTDLMASYLKHSLDRDQ